MLSHLPKRREEFHTDDVADGLLASYETASAHIQHVNSYELVSTEEVASIVEQCRALMFPGFVGPSLARATPTELRDHVRERLDTLRNGLRKQLYRDLHHRVQHDCPRCATAAAEITDGFLGGMVALRERIVLDVQAAFDGDPAAKDTDEIIFCYPGLYAISVYRIAHALRELGARLIPRIMTELAHEKTGIDIHPGATIGKSFFIDHGTGVVIGETTIIGDRVRIYQGVTLGALSVTRDKRPGTVIGKGAVIGGNCWVTASVPAHTTVTLSRCRTTDNQEQGECSVRPTIESMGEPDDSSGDEQEL
jgi:serine O-acetyltransferase